MKKKGVGLVTIHALSDPLDIHRIFPPFSDFRLLAMFSKGTRHKDSFPTDKNVFKDSRLKASAIKKQGDNICATLETNVSSMTIDEVLESLPSDLREKIRRAYVPGQKLPYGDTRQILVFDDRNLGILVNNSIFQVESNGNSTMVS